MYYGTSKTPPMLNVGLSSSEAEGIHGVQEEQSVGFRAHMLHRFGIGWQLGSVQSNDPYTAFLLTDF